MIQEVPQFKVLFSGDQGSLWFNLSTVKICVCTLKAHIIASFRAFDSSKNVQTFGFSQFFHVFRRIVTNFCSPVYIINDVLELDDTA